jgi:hypothetical protein
MKSKKKNPKQITNAASRSTSVTSEEQQFSLASLVDTPSTLDAEKEVPSGCQDLARPEKGTILDSSVTTYIAPLRNIHGKW